MKRIIRALPLLIILFCAPLLYGETIIEQASLQLASDVAVARANGIFLESVDEELLVAYQGASAIQLGRLSGDGWSAVALPISGSAILQGFAADGQLLVFGYIEERALWTSPHSMGTNLPLPHQDRGGARPLHPRHGHR